MATADSIRHGRRTRVAGELVAISEMTTGELHERYAELFGEAPRSRNRQYLVRRIAWRLQANAEGGLTTRALKRAAELANDAEIRLTPPKHVSETPMVERAVDLDPRLPSPGTALVRKYKGRTHEVRVLDDGFEHGGQRYRSLSAVAKAITGTHVNGFRFFGLGGKP